MSFDPDSLNRTQTIRKPFVPPPKISTRPAEWYLEAQREENTAPSIRTGRALCALGNDDALQATIRAKMIEHVAQILRLDPSVDACVAWRHYVDADFNWERAVESCRREKGEMMERIVDEEDAAVAAARARWEHATGAEESVGAVVPKRKGGRKRKAEKVAGDGPLAGLAATTPAVAAVAVGAGAGAVALVAPKGGRKRKAAAAEEKVEAAGTAVRVSKRARTKPIRFGETVEQETTTAPLPPTFPVAVDAASAPTATPSAPPSAPKAKKADKGKKPAARKVVGARGAKKTGKRPATPAGPVVKEEEDDAALYAERTPVPTEGEKEEETETGKGAEKKVRSERVAKGKGKGKK
ncbi:hypothetical protein MMC13_002372 [Lambiella insularis]|nr:hypothetical protein [Lambiella insularis]